MEIIKYSDGRQVTANSGFATKHHEHSLRLIGYPVMESAVCSGSWPDTVITDRPDLDDVKALKDSDPDCANEKCHSKGNYGVVYKEEKLLPLCKPCYEQWSGNKHWSWRDKF